MLKRYRNKIEIALLNRMIEKMQSKAPKKTLTASAILRAEAMKLEYK